MWLSRKRMKELSDEFHAIEAERDKALGKVADLETVLNFTTSTLCETQTAALEMQQEINFHRDLCLPQLSQMTNN